MAGLLLSLWAAAWSHGARASPASVALGLSLVWAALGSQGTRCASSFVLLCSRVLFGQQYS